MTRKVVLAMAPLPPSPRADNPAKLRSCHRLGRLKRQIWFTHAPHLGLLSPRQSAACSHGRAGGLMTKRSHYLFTSESVSEGHPDKVADRISDTVVDAFLAAEPEARVACETLVTTNRIVLAGEVRAGARSREQGYRIDEPGGQGPRRRSRTSATSRRASTGRKAKYACHLHAQSADIAQGVDASEQEGRGRRRPGHHVRLRHRRDAGADAGHPAVLPQHPAAPGRGAPLRRVRRAWSPTPRARSPCATRTAAGARCLQIVLSTQHKKRIGLTRHAEAHRASSGPTF